MPAERPAAAPQVQPRLTERHVLALGLAAAGAFVIAAGVAGILMLASGGSPWAAIHLALAGAAVTAIGAFMPHFAVTLAGTRPAPSPQRLASLIMLAGGASAVVIGMLAGLGWVAASGSAIVIGGLGLVAAHTVAPLREPLARRHHVVSLVYGVALLEMAAGVALGGVVAIGQRDVLGAWATLRGAHAWLTLFGAVSLTIFGTLVYLAPTVLGARIKAGPGLMVGALGMLIGPAVVVVGFVVDAAPVVIAGMVATLAGAGGQIAYVIDTYRRRGPFTSEHDWRRVAIGHLVGGTGWFALAVVVAAYETLSGRPLAGWSMGALAVPMIAGWMLQELVGSWTHLAPSVTPGDAARHARQRRILAFASRSRLVAWNAGIGLVWIGLAFGVDAAVLVGAPVLGLTALLSVGLLTRALATR